MINRTIVKRKQFSSKHITRVVFLVRRRNFSEGTTETVGKEADGGKLNIESLNTTRSF